MNVLKSKLHRQQQLERAKGGNSKSPTRFSQTPRNLQEVPSAHDLQSGNAPSNIYHDSQMSRIMKESKQYEQQMKSGSFKHLLADIQKRSVEQDTQKMNEKFQSSYSVSGNVKQLNLRKSGMQLAEGVSFKEPELKTPVKTDAQRQSAQSNSFISQSAPGVGSIRVRKHKTYKPSIAEMRRVKIEGVEQSPRTIEKWEQDPAVQIQKQIKPQKYGVQPQERPSTVQDKMMLSTHEFFKPKKAGIVQQTPRMSGGASKKNLRQSSVDELTAIIQPQQVAEEKEVAARMAEFQLSALEKNQTSTDQTVPLKQSKQDEIMFNEIFVKPQQLAQQEFQKQADQAVMPYLQNQEAQRKQKEYQQEKSKVTLIQSHQMSSAEPGAYQKMQTKEKVGRLIKLQDGGTSFVEELEDGQNPAFNMPDLGNEDQQKQRAMNALQEGQFNILDLIMQKFNMNPKELQDKGCFTQQIRMQPPDMLRSVIQNPLGSVGMGSKVTILKAPSIPLSVRSSALHKPLSMHENVQDLILKAKAGIQQGDFIKETHINFQMGELSESQNQLDAACHYYKRFYLCARVLNDATGSALALNRLGVCYFKRMKFEMSYLYNQKHAQFVKGDDQFIAVYNSAISSRLLGQYDKSINEFEQAMQLVAPRNDMESESLCFGQIGVVLLLQGQMEESASCFQKCLKIAKKLHASKMQLECLLCLAYINFDSENWVEAKSLFDQAYFVSNEIGEKKIGEQCLCNAGIASGNIMLKDTSKQQENFYKSFSNGFGAGAEAKLPETTNIFGGFGPPPNFNINFNQQEDDSEDSDDEQNNSGSADSRAEQL